MKEKPVRMIRLKDFRTVSHALSTYEDFSLMINHFIEAVIRAFNVKGCSLLLLDEAENQLFHVRSQGVSEEYLKKGAIFIDEQYSSFVTGAPVFVEDLQNDPRIQYPEAAAKEGFVSMATFPIKCKQAIVGMIRVYHNKVWSLHDEDIESFCVLAEHLGLVIENNGLKNFLETIKAAVESLPARMINRP
ncbi:putative GAF sensor protein [uncultured Desulfobacterium sp.]|uniref:Putative GAF sensor protein n=1 Tax=uncultured Desulfobacterium sp. TaxID=201089 RepID=A0A445N0P4_9BACT|nr:putative GAF sensor protein [uncultured Desulfobacterium sp.]